MIGHDFGIGVYSVPEAARMVGMSGQSLKRWLLGYEHTSVSGINFQKPLWEVQHNPNEHDLFLGFRDLVEAKIVYGLRNSGVSLQGIRQCLDNARDIVQDAHPFSTKHFKTDGRSLFLEIAENANDPQLIDLKHRQHVFRTVVAPSLSGLEFGDEAAERWWLLTGKKTVVADPARSFGHPILTNCGVTTKRVFQAFEAEGSVENVARIYEIRTSDVKDALTYERSLVGAALH